MAIVITIEDARKVKQAVEIADKILELIEEKKKIQKRIEELKGVLESLGIEIKREGDKDGEEG